MNIVLNKMSLSQQIATLPTRKSFLDAELSGRLQKAIGYGKPVLFKPHSASADNIYYQGLTNTMIVLYGVLEDGSRATAILKNVLSYFYVWVPKGSDPEELVRKLGVLLDGMTLDEYEKWTEDKIREFDRKKFNISPLNMYVEEYKKFLYYRDYTKSRDACVRLEFNTTKERDWCLNVISKKTKLETAEDQGSSDFVNVVCRDHELSFNKWAELSKYINYKQTRYYDENVLLLDIENYKIQDPEPEHLQKDPMITLAWDIETFNEDGAFPLVENPRSKIFMIGMCFHWHHSTEPLLRVCITDYDCEPHPDFEIIRCTSEMDILKAFAAIAGRMKPDFMIAFNDGQYDWPWVAGRARTYKLLREFHRALAHSGFGIEKDADVERFIRNHSIKYEAGKARAVYNMWFPGCIPIDMMVEYMRWKPTLESHSLNNLLKFMKLPLKKDMPISTMNQIYRRCHESDACSPENRKAYTLLAEYCVYDSQRVQDLAVRGNRIFDARAVADVSFMPMHSIVYFAGGKRVINLTLYEAKKKGFLLSCIVKDRVKSHFPGGYVVKPRTELIKPKLSVEERRIKYPEWHNMTDTEVQEVYAFVAEHGAVLSLARLEALEAEYPILRKAWVREFLAETCHAPITALDFASLYPSLMMAYNISPDKIIHPDDDLAKYEGRKIHHVEFMINGNETFKGNILAHENKLDPEDDMFGLFPDILYRLKTKRKQLQTGVLKPIVKQLEQIRLQYAPTPHDQKRITELSKLEVRSPEEENELAELKLKYPGPPPEVQAKIDRLDFERMSVDSIQNAQKVFMNTFYGESGRAFSPLFLLQVSGGITHYGRQNLRNAIEYLRREERCVIYYGDTDSCYFTLDPALFEEDCRLYYSGRSSKEEFMRECVRKTQEGVVEIRDRVNDYLLADNGTRFLTMDYEEVLYPAFFISKKMYMGTPHIEKINFLAKPFIKGLSSKKRGTSGLHTLKTNDLVSRILDINNTYTVYENVCMIIREIYNTEWDFERDLGLFVLIKEYSPGKSNISMNNFVSRMRDKGMTIYPADKLEIIYVKYDPLTIKGTNSKVSTSEYMEHISFVKEHRMPINLESYFASGLDGQFAAFIAMESEFEVPMCSEEELNAMSAFDRNEYEKDIGSKRRKKAKKHLELYRKSLEGIDVEQIKQAKKVCYKEFSTRIKEEYSPSIARIMLDLLDDKYDCFKEIIAEFDAESVPADYGRLFILKVLKQCKSDSRVYKYVRRAYYDPAYYESDIDVRINMVHLRLKHWRAELIEWRDAAISALRETAQPELLDPNLYRCMFDDFVELGGLMYSKKKIHAIRAAYKARED